MTILLSMPDTALSVSIVKPPLSPFVVSPVDKVIALLISEVSESTVFIVIDPDDVDDDPLHEVMLILPLVHELLFSPMSKTAPPVALLEPLLKVNYLSLPEKLHHL